MYSTSFNRNYVKIVNWRYSYWHISDNTYSCESKLVSSKLSDIPVNTEKSKSNLYFIIFINPCNEFIFLIHKLSQIHLKPSNFHSLSSSNSYWVVSSPVSIDRELIGISDWDNELWLPESIWSMDGGNFLLMPALLWSILWALVTIDLARGLLLEKINGI